MNTRVLIMGIILTISLCFNLHQRNKIVSFKQLDTEEVKQLKVKLDSVHNFYIDSIETVSSKRDTVFQKMIKWRTRFIQEYEDIEVPSDPDSLSNLLNELSNE